MKGHDHVHDSGDVLIKIALISPFLYFLFCNIHMLHNHSNGQLLKWLTSICCSAQQSCVYFCALFIHQHVCWTMCSAFWLFQVDYIHVLELTRDNVCTVVGLPSMIGDFKQLHVTLSPPTLYYDTTFCMGDFYVSCLLYRNVVFDGSPVMPLLMLIHERRTTESHELLFKWFRKLTSILSAVVVADREQAITNAVHNILPGSSGTILWVTSEWVSYVFVFLFVFVECSFMALYSCLCILFMLTSPPILMMP